MLQGVAGWRTVHLEGQENVRMVGPCQGQVLEDPTSWG